MAVYSLPLEIPGWTVRAKTTVAEKAKPTPAVNKARRIGTEVGFAM
jgi:hypothetical protein